MRIDSAFLKKNNKVLDLKVKCATCGNEIQVFINDMASAGEVWSFCEKCGTYVDVAPSN